MQGFHARHVQGALATRGPRGRRGAQGHRTVGSRCGHRQEQSNPQRRLRAKESLRRRASDRPARRRPKRRWTVARPQPEGQESRTAPGQWVSSRARPLQVCRGGRARGNCVQGRDVVGEAVLRATPVIANAVRGVPEQAGLDTMRLKQFGDAIEALLKGSKRLARQVGIQKRKALEGCKGSRAEALLSEPEPNASGKASERASSEAGAIHGSMGRRCCSRAFTHDTRKELRQ